MPNKLTKDESVKISKEHKKIVQELAIKHRRTVKAVMELAIEQFNSLQLQTPRNNDN